ncbi:hypothetical protein Tco_0636796, partial [Tanacetum coccineum]
ASVMRTASLATKPCQGDSSEFYLITESIYTDQQGTVVPLMIGAVDFRREEAGIQLQAKEFDLIAAAADLEEIEEVNVNCILMANLQQVSTSEEQYTELLKPIPEPHQVQQNDSNVISDASSVEQDGETVDQHPETVEETHAYFESLYNNLAIEVEMVNSVNRKMKETNSVYQEQCLTKKINALHLSFDKQITTLNEEISNLNKQLSKVKSTVSFLQEERKKLKNDFKTCEDELLDKQIQLDNKIKELDNILVKTCQLIQTMHMLSPKPDSFYHTEQKMALGYQNPFYLKQAQWKQQSLYNGKVLFEKHDPPAVYDLEETLQLDQKSHLKMKQLNKEIKPANYTKINHLSGVFVSQTAKSREESYFLNTSKTANVSKSFSIPNEEFSDDTTLSVARKFLNEVKSTIVTLQCVVKQKMTLDIHNWSSSAHQEIHKIVKDEIFPIVNQVDARVQNFEIQFLKEAAKFVRDFQSIAKEANESLGKHKALELEIERLLRAVVSQDIMSIVQNPSVVDTSNLQTELERTKERFENCIIKKDNEYAKLSNDWYKKCEECKYDKISKDTPYVSKTLDPLSQKLENENVEVEFQVSEQKDTIHGTSMNTKFAKQSILGKLPPYFKPKLYSVTPFPKSIVIPKAGESNALSKPVTSNLAPSSRESTVVNNERVIVPGIFRINPFKAYKVGSKERLASPKPSTPRSCLRWSPTGRMFDLKGKIIATSESEYQRDCSKSDNACTSNPQEPINKRFPSSTFSMTGCQNWLDTLLIPLLSEYKLKDKENHEDNECDS